MADGSNAFIGIAEPVLEQVTKKIKLQKPQAGRFLCCRFFFCRKNRPAKFRQPMSTSAIRVAAGEKQTVTKRPLI